jgi:hypothetical protein
MKSKLKIILVVEVLGWVKSGTHSVVIHYLFLATKVHKAGGTRSPRRPFGPSFGALIDAPGLPS